MYHLELDSEAAHAARSISVFQILLILNSPELSGQAACEAGGLVCFNELLGGAASFFFYAFNGEPSLLLFLKCIEFREPNTFQYFSKFFDA